MSKCYDVIIVGGGIIGCATAYELAKAGAKVALLERGQIGTEASGRNAGTFNLLNDRMMDDKPLAVLRTALDRWRNLSDELDYDLDVNLDMGTLLVGETSADFARLAELKRLYAGKGIELDLLDRAALDDRSPFISPDVHAALFCSTGGLANPRQAAWAFARKAGHAGACVRTGVEVLDVSASATCFVVRTNGDCYTAGSVVIAAGPWTNRLLAPFGVEVPMRIRYFQASVTTAAPHFIPHCIRRVGGMITLKQTARGNCILGGGWEGQSAFPEHGSIDMKSLRGNLEVAARIVPGFGSLSLLRTWAGYDGSSLDEQPVIDEVEQHSGLFISTGSSGGFTHGPVFGQMTANLVAGHVERHDYSRFRLSRFTKGPVDSAA